MTDNMYLFISDATDMFDIIIFNSLVSKKRIFNFVQSMQKAFDVCCTVVCGIYDGAKKALGSWIKSPLELLYVGVMRWWFYKLGC